MTFVAIHVIQIVVFSWAVSLFGVALLMSLYVFGASEHLECFLPILFFKILISHVLREEPYQPE
ncbi:hypothetical protein [Ruegeria sp. ANG-R]|uniref:hypothetical protein n=1 Tax=Ruegeria sp. ANG-R TaxID=1577903 RepID=UPI00068FC4AA|nr:hypothetical protein [Ruegeria sp. ANG-R]